jgi:hypothetical protein
MNRKKGPFKHSKSAVVCGTQFPQVGWLVS